MVHSVCFIHTVIPSVVVFVCGIESLSYLLKPYSVPASVGVGLREIGI